MGIGDAEYEKKVEQAVEMVSSLRSKEAQRFARSLKEKGAQLFIRLPDGRDIEVNIPTE